MLNAGTVQVIAQTQGIEHLSEDIAQALAQDVEYRMREIVQEGLKFASHSRRTRLAADDVNRSLRLLNVEGLYGISEGAEFVRAGGPNQDLFFIPDSELDTRKMLQQELFRLPPVPVDPSFHAHWLAIDGSQPLVVENPLPADILKRLSRKKRREKYLARQGSGERRKGTKRSFGDKRSASSGASSSGGAADSGAQASGAGTGGSTSSSVDPTVVKHVLSKELIHYFEVVVDAVRGFGMVAEEEAGAAAEAAAAEEEEHVLAGLSGAEREARRKQQQQQQQLEDEARETRGPLRRQNSSEPLGALKKSEAEWGAKRSSTAASAEGMAVDGSSSSAALGMDVEVSTVGTTGAGGSGEDGADGFAPSVELVAARARRAAQKQARESARKVLRAVLESLTTDAGLQSLVPYFVDFVGGEVSKNMEDAYLLSALMYMTKALLLNPNLSVELFLSRLMPPILSTLMGHPLCPDPTRNEDHWALRNLAATVLGIVVKKFCPSHRNLETKICNSLIQGVFDGQATLAARYGALLGIAHLRAEKIRSLLLDPLGDSNARFLHTLLEEEAVQSEGDSFKQRCVARCSFALLQAVNSYFRKMGRSIQEAQRDAVRAEGGSWDKERLDNASLRLGRTLAANAGLAEHFEDMEEVFGSSLTPLNPDLFLSGPLPSGLESVML